MRFVLLQGDAVDAGAEPTVAIDDPYVDLVYGPLVGAMAVLVLRYLHASLPLRSDPICTVEELAAATGSKPRRMAGPLRRLTRHRLIVFDPPVRDWAAGPGAATSSGSGPATGPRHGVGPPTGPDPLADEPAGLLLPRRLPLVSTRSLDRLPPLARRVDSDRRER